MSLVILGSATLEDETIGRTMSHAAGRVASGLTETQQVARALMDPGPTLYDAGKGAGNGLNTGRIFKVARKNARTRDDGCNKDVE